MDICLHTNSELELGKDEPGFHAAFKEQSSSASHMTAAKVMDVIPRQPECAGEAADAVSACTQVNMEDALPLWKLPRAKCPDIWARLPRHIWLKSWSNIEEPVVPLDQNLYGHLLAGLVWEKDHKAPNWECLFVHRQHGLFMSVFVDDTEMAGKNQNLDPTWKKMIKRAHLGEPTSFFDHVYFGCSQRECKPNEGMVDEYKKMFESRISEEATETWPWIGENGANVTSWSCDMEGHAKKCAARYCEWANKTTKQLF